MAAFSNKSFFSENFTHNCFSSSTIKVHSYTSVLYLLNASVLVRNMITLNLADAFTGVKRKYIIYKNCLKLQKSKLRMKLN